MANPTMGVHEFEPGELVKLVKQYDCFMISQGNNSFLQIRVPSRWVKLEMRPDGVSYITCRNKRNSS